MSEDIVMRLRDEADADKYGHLRHELLAALLEDGAKEIEKLRDALRDVDDLIDGYVDADHNGSGFVPNDAMRAQQRIHEALGDE